MSDLINNIDVKSKVSGSFGSFLSEKTNITIGVTDRFIYKEISNGKSSETKIFPHSRIDSYGIEVSQAKVWLVLGVIISIFGPFLIFIGETPLSSSYGIMSLPVVVGLIFLIVWMMSRKLVFIVNTISKERLEIKLQSTNTIDVEKFIIFLNQKVPTL